MLAIVLAVALVLVLGGFAWRFVTTRPAGEPQAVELTDATLSKTLTSATVLAVGEATHGTAEFQQVRRHVLAKVVADGFTTVALEDSAGTATQVDAWLQGGAGTAEEAAKRFGYGIYHTRQMADLLTWIRDYNKSTPAERRIRLYGIDVQPPEADKQVVL
ncbi:MAG: erythromycin esterase family protein, partial [Propionibacteriaceae bacterium]|nr:erythromycin esterase family protein [Propionibacteriaceae bacterium]